VHNTAEDEDHRVTHRLTDRAAVLAGGVVPAVATQASSAECGSDECDGPAHPSRDNRTAIT
jgi:hypothetical protein